ncbi:MAG TPA: hypothetical protein VII12_00450, partial [Thermoanaerobaculia bacterium]
RGVWIGIANYVVHGAETCDMHFIGSAAYDDKDTDWAVHAQYRPEAGEAESAALHQIYQIAYETETSLGNDAEWPICLAYAVFAVAELLRGASSAFFGGGRKIGVSVGFDEGDFVVMRSLR